MAYISRANLKFCGSHCGVSIGEDGTYILYIIIYNLILGASQMAIEDLAIFRGI